jgi:hypothetical protein
MAPRIKNSYFEGYEKNNDLEDGRAGYSKMAPLINNACDESITKNCAEHVSHLAVPNEGNAFETAEVGANDGSKNQQTSCPGKLWECIYITAMVICSFCFLYTIYARVPAAARNWGIVMIVLGYCNYIFWTCKSYLESEEGSQER